MRYLILICTVLFMGMTVAFAEHQDEKQVLPSGKPYILKKKSKESENMKPVTMGWVEEIIVGTTGKKVQAKLDTGAKTSSIAAEIVKIIPRDGKKYVLYKLLLEDDSSNDELFESEVIRTAKIKRKGEEKGKRTVSRPVVLMDFCLGNQHIIEEVNLAVRDRYNYPVLIGRNMLSGRVLVDSSKTLTLKPSCKEKK